MKQIWFGLMVGVAAALSCVGADEPVGTLQFQLLCAEAVTDDPRGAPRNAAGRIRECWPGESNCHCDADNDCYALAGYVACEARATDSPPVVLRKLLLPADTVAGTFATSTDGVEPEPTGSPFTYCQRHHGGAAARAYALQVTERVGVELVAAGPVPNGSFIKTIALRRASNPAADIACEDWGDNDADTYGWWPRLRRVLEPGEYIVLVDGWAGESFELAVGTFATPTSSRCATAPSLTDTSSTCDSSLGGRGAVACYPSDTRPQSFYSVTIPPWQRALVRGIHLNYDTLFVLRAYASCNATQCLGAARSGGVTLTTRDQRNTVLAVDNRRDTPRRVIIGASAAPSATSEVEGFVSVSYAPLAATAAPNALCRNAMVVSHGTRLVGEDTRLALSAATCDNAVFQGHALYYSVRVPARRTLVVSATSAGADPIAPHIRLLGACGAETCLASVPLGRPRTNPVRLRYDNDAYSARTLLIAVSDTFASAGGRFDLDVAFEPYVPSSP